MLAEQVGYVVGVDTHRDQHALAVVDAHSGAVIAQAVMAASARGYADAVGFADRHAPGDRLWAVEGSGHYGAGLVRHLQRRHEQVREVELTSRGERRRRGKDDQLDAVRAARCILAQEQRATPRSGEHQEALRLLLLARRTAVDTRKVALVQLRSVIVTAPDGLREELRRLPLGEAAQPLQPLPPPQLTDTRSARDHSRPAHARPSHPDRYRRSRDARAGDPQPRPGACA